MNLLLTVGIAMTAGLLSSRMMKMIHLPNVTGFLVIGLVIGPSVLGILPDESLSSLEILVTVALGFIAFSIGESFQHSHLRLIGKSVFIITLSQSLLAAFSVDTVLILCGYPIAESILLGAIATATAPAATIMVIRQYQAEGPLTDTLLPVVALDDAVGLMVFSVSAAIARTLIAGGPVNISTMFLHPLLQILCSLALGAAVGLLLSAALTLFESHSSRLMLCITAVILALAGSNHFSLSDLLVCMSAGAVLINLRTDASDVMDSCDDWTPPLFLLFFVLSGAELDLRTLPTVGFLGLLYIVLRTGGKYCGAFLGASIVKADPKIRKYLGITLLPQAGVAIGMAQMALHMAPEYGSSIHAVVLAATVIYELIGPVATKIALIKAGEIKV